MNARLKRLETQIQAMKGPGAPVVKLKLTDGTIQELPWYQAMEMVLDGEAVEVMEGNNGDMSGMLQAMMPAG